MIKKYFFVLMSFFVFFLSVNYSDATIDEAVNAARPDRSTPWYLSDKPNITFNEYYISATDLACGFRAFGYDSRESAIDAMLKALADQDPRYTKRNEKLREYIKNDYAENISVEEYLNKIKKTQYELPFNANKLFLDNDNVVKKIYEPLNIPYTFINAFALLTHKNLHIYNIHSNENKNIYLSHSFMHDSGSVKEDLFLLCKGIHYNKLVPTGYQGTNARAKDAEDKYLTELRLRLMQGEENSRQQVSDICTTFVHDESEIQPELILNNNVSVENQEIQENILNNNILPSNHLNNIILDDDIDEPIEEFSAIEIKDFILGKRKMLPDCTIEQSLIGAYQQAENVFDKENALFVYVQLYLKRNYVPNASFVEDLIKKLDVLIKKKGSKSKTKKHRHYASIFKGQIYVKMNRLDDAWRIFADLNEKKNSFTKTFWLDMAEMILLHDYTPGGMNREEATKLAWELFNKKVNSRNTHRSKNTKKVIINDIVIVPAYYNSKVSNERREKVLSVVEDRNRQRATPVQNRFNQPESVNNQSVVSIDRPQNILGRKRSDRIDSQQRANKRQRVGQDECVNIEISVLSDDNNDTIINNNHHHEFLNEENINGSSDDSVELDNSVCSSNFLMQLDENNLKNIELRKLILEGKHYCFLKDGKNALICFKKVIMLCGSDCFNEYYVQALIGLGNARDPERLQSDFYQKAEKIAYEKGFKQLECEALIGRWNARDPECLRYELYQDAEKIAYENGYKELECEALIGRGNARDPERLKCYQEAEKLARENGYTELLCHALIGRGNARDPEGLQCYQEAEKIAYENGYKELECRALIGRGNARDPERLQYEFYQKAEKIAYEKGFKQLECEALIGRGNAHDPEGLQCYQEAEKIVYENGYKELECRALIGRGNARDPERLQYEFYQEGEKIARDHGYTKLECEALIGRGNARDPERLQYEFYQKAEDIARKNGYKKLNYDALMGMGNYYSHAKKQNKDALYCYEDALKLNISRSDNDKARKGIERVERFLSS
ncbi:MAG: hypothetical protein Q8L85_07185 [Alphaproteobacteria bacterium]|nr:hypothetical protein [Alphaproteobacteria bacterium]